MVSEDRAEHAFRWATITCIASKLNVHRESLRAWIRQSQRHTGQRPGLATEERARLTALERETKELRRANEILKKAAECFAQAELDRRPT